MTHQDPETGSAASADVLTTEKMRKYKRSRRCRHFKKTDQRIQTLPPQWQKLSWC